MTEIIEVKVGRLGSELRPFTFPSGVTVAEVVQRADINGETHTVKINGLKVSMDTQLNENCTLVAIAEFEAGK